jgi:hypothetical protein
VFSHSVCFYTRFSRTFLFLTRSESRRIRGRRHDRSDSSSGGADVGDWLRFMSNAVVPDVEALNRGTDKARREENRPASLRVTERDEPHQSQTHSLVSLCKGQEENHIQGVKYVTPPISAPKAADETLFCHITDPLPLC